MTDVHLNDHELAALDFLIASKRAGTLPNNFINDVIMCEIAVSVKAVTATALTAIEAVAGGGVLSMVQAMGTRMWDEEGLSLARLVAARENALKTAS